MTTTQAAYAAILSMDGPPQSRIDRIRARMTANRALRTVQGTREARLHRLPENHGLEIVANPGETRPRGLHPGDIFYWVACLGGACLLLLCATT